MNSRAMATANTPATISHTKTTMVSIGDSLPPREKSYAVRVNRRYREKPQDGCGKIPSSPVPGDRQFKINRLLRGSVERRERAVEGQGTSCTTSATRRRPPGRDASGPRPPDQPLAGADRPRPGHAGPDHDHGVARGRAGDLRCRAG